MSATKKSMPEEPETIAADDRDLVDRIETTRFIGSEFLVWLWFKTELFEGELKRPDGSDLSVWLDSELVLQSATDAQERIRFNGVAPSATDEAKLALRYDKVPVRAKVSLGYDAKEFSFVYDAVSFSFGSVKLPALITQPGDERFQERVHLLELLDTLWNELYAEFLGLRLSAVWENELVPAIKHWAQRKPTLSSQAYRGLLKRAG